MKVHLIATIILLIKTNILFGQNAFLLRDNISINDSAKICITVADTSTIKYIEIVSYQEIITIRSNTIFKYITKFESPGIYNIEIRFRDTSNNIISNQNIKVNIIKSRFLLFLDQVWGTILGTILGALITIMVTLFNSRIARKREEKNAFDYVKNLLLNTISRDILPEILLEGPIQISTWLNLHDIYKNLAFKANVELHQKHDKLIEIIEDYNKDPYMLYDDTIAKINILKTEISNIILK